MSDWTPKVGDRVMVGEHGPYVVESQGTRAGWRLCDLELEALIADSGPPSWLTPAPEPEPEMPTAPGALVRDGKGALRTLYVDLNVRRWYLTRGGLGVGLDWPDLPRPITVVLADPAEVETLRERADQLEQLVVDMDTKHDELVTEVDELQRRIDKVLSKKDEWGGILYEATTQILRGEQ